MFHPGFLTANINGIADKPVAATFNGETWSLFWPRSEARPPRLAEVRDLLNDATASTPKSHIGICELAELSLRKAGLFDSTEILNVKTTPADDSAFDPDALL